MKDDYKLKLLDFFPVYGSFFYLARNDVDLPCIPVSDEVQKREKILFNYNNTLFFTILSISVAKGIEKLISN